MRPGGCALGRCDHTDGRCGPGLCRVVFGCADGGDPGLLGPDLCWSPAHAGVGALWLAGFGLPLPHPDFAVVQVPPMYRGIPVVARRFMAAATRLGVDVQVWTVNEPDQMVHLLDIGVGAIMTDWPRVLRDLLQARGQWQPDPSRA